MSKSDALDKASIFLLDPENIIRKKIASAVTDSDGTIKFDPVNKPGISNLLTIYSCASNTPIEELVEKYKDSGYGDFKKDVADAVVNLLIPIQEKYNYYLNSKELDIILDNGRDKAAYFARKTLSKMKRKMGIIRKK
jgi:tryptophanyl-tRNA synthetase